MGLHGSQIYLHGKYPTLCSTVLGRDSAQEMCKHWPKRTAVKQQGLMGTRSFQLSSPGSRCDRLASAKSRVLIFAFILPAVLLQSCQAWWLWLPSIIKGTLHSGLPHVYSVCKAAQRRHSFQKRENIDMLSGGGNGCRCCLPRLQ